MTVYVGMDVHRKRSQVAVVDDAGVPQRNRNLPNDPAHLVPILAWLATRGWPLRPPTTAPQPQANQPSSGCPGFARPNSSWRS